MTVLLVGFQPRRAMSYPHLRQVADSLFADGAGYSLFRERGYFLGSGRSGRGLFRWLLSVAATAAAVVADTLALLARRIGGRYGTVVAVDNVAYIVASALFPQAVLWSHDFLTADEPRSKRPVQQWIGRRLEAALRRHRRLIIQDEERLALFAGTYPAAPVPAELDVFLLPVSLLPVAIAERDRPATPPVAMQIGGINATRSRSDELLTAYQESHGDYRLAFHGFVAPEMAAAIAQAPLKPLLSGPVDAADVHLAIDGCDVGIIAYGPVNANFFHVARASGQMAEFMRAARPVVVLGESTLGRAVEEEGVGVTITEAAQLGAAIRRIADQWPGFHDSCRRLYLQTYDLSRYLPALHAWLAKRPQE